MAAAGFTVLFVAVQWGLAQMIYVFIPAAADWDVLLVSAICDFGLIMLFIPLCRMISGGHRQMPSPKDIGIINLVLIVAGIYCCDIFSSSVISLFDLDANSSYSQVTAAIQSGTVIMQVAALVIIAPLAEELAFRGTVFGSLRRSFGFWPAALLSALAFAAMHMNMVQGVATFVVGVFFAFLYEKFGKIWVPVFAHMVMNAMAVFGMQMQEMISENAEKIATEVSDTAGQDAVRMVIGAGAALLIYFAIKKSKYPVRRN